MYFNYPIYGYREEPGWLTPLAEAIRIEGYLAFMPSRSIDAMYKAENLKALSSYHQKVVRTMCPMFKNQEEITFPINHASVIPMMEQAEKMPDVASFTFRELWFLNRSSVMVADFSRACRELAFVQRLVYAKLFDIPIIGISSGAISFDPWIQKSISVLLTDDFNVMNILPLIKGYAPNAR